MSTDFSIRPVGAPAVTPVTTVASQAATSAVSTDLPASQSVTVADPSAAARNDAQAATAADQFISHQAYFDRAAASMVFQVVNGKNDQVVEQFPDDAALRRRTYFHALDLAKEEPGRVPATDRTA